MLTPSSAKRSANHRACLRRIGAIGVDKQCNIIPNCLTRNLNAVQIPLSIAAHLHLHHPDALFLPSLKLCFQLSIGIAGKPAATINGHAVPDPPEQGN